MRFRATMLAAACGVLVFSNGTFAGDMPAGGAAPSEPAAVSYSSLGEQLLAENPTLLKELLKGLFAEPNSSDSSEFILHSIYALGGKTALHLVPYLTADDPKLQSGAFQAMLVLMAHEDFPTAEMVPHFLKLAEAENPEISQMGRYMVAYAIRLTIPEVRQAMQAEVQREFTGQ